MIKCTHLSKKFPAPRGSFHVLRDFSLTLSPNEIVGLVGPNGAGKTTFFHILMGFLTTDSGEVLQVENQPQEIKNPLEVFSLLPEHPKLPKYATGYFVLHEFGLYSGLSENHLVPRLENLADTFSAKSFWKSPCGKYSKGQAQIISLMRLLLAPKKYVLLDEPTTGLDFEMAIKVRREIKMLAERGHGVVFSSHALDDIQKIADRVVGLREGKNVDEKELSSWMEKWSKE